ncbi:hypothetical protein JCGZ_08275 [Jatropha curcas]|uniref:Uncharacterized protein n=1 Tax=Jatropha curcas TaxID=180498 RepID=A0A067KZZ2_JATCU|nr:hypothetical protein JCGZ_08275 [Jatropha curcas]
MVRGRAVDSNTSNSGPHGGHGRGRSTRGRGGTIPPPSSSTSRASPSAQPPVPPPLPSIPSSSTLFPEPADSSLASQSPTALEPHNKLSLVAG